MNKSKKWLKNNQFVLLGFLVPLLVWLVICIGIGITPFGPYSLLISDLEGGHIDGLTKFRDIVLEGKSLAYCWGQIQGSTPFAALGLGTLVSTFNFLVLLVQPDQILAALTWIIILRIACCGATCAFYLKKVFRRSNVSISMFGWCYALMAYTVIYYFHIIWLDQIMMLPLVLWGVEKILKDKKDYIYFTITLIAIFFMNFYMAYMTGVFAFLYFIYRYLAIHTQYKVKDFLGKLISFMISPLLAFGCSSILLLPIFKLMSGRDGLFDSGQMIMKLRYEFTGLMSKLCIGSFDTIMPGGLPYIYCGLIVVICMFFYFLSYAVSYKEKLLTFFLGLFMFLSMTINPLYVAWHGFKPPVYFEGRFTYIVCFLMIFIGYKGYHLLNTISMKQIHWTFGILAVAIILLNRQVYNYITDESLLYTIVFLIGYYLIIVFIKQKVHYKKLAQMILVIVVAVELGNNAMVSINKMDQGVAFPLENKYVAAYQTIKNDVNEIMSMDKGFYRIEKDIEKSMNDGFGLSYPSITHFDSIYNYQLKETIGKLGVQVGHNWIRYKGTTPISELLMNIKYIMIREESYQSYAKVKEKEFVNYYQNPYAVSVGFMVQDRLGEVLTAENPILYQEKILNKMVGSTDAKYFKPLAPQKIEKNNVEEVEKQMVVSEEESYPLIVFYRTDDYKDGALNYILKPELSGPCYLYVDQRSYGKMQIEVNDEKTIDPEFESGNRIIYLGDFKKGEQVKVSFNFLQKEFVVKDIWFYSLDTQVLKEVSEQLSQQALAISRHTDTVLEGSIQVDGSRTYLYTSIPYDKGWHIYVDNEEVTTINMLQGFLGASIESGKHNIRLSYIPQGYHQGVIITSISLGIFIVLILYKYYGARYLRKKVKLQSKIVKI